MRLMPVGPTGRTEVNVALVYIFHEYPVFWFTLFQSNPVSAAGAALCGVWQKTQISSINTLSTVNIPDHLELPGPAGELKSCLLPLMEAATA